MKLHKWKLGDRGTLFLVTQGATVANVLRKFAQDLEEK